MLFLHREFTLRFFNRLCLAFQNSSPANPCSGKRLSCFQSFQIFCGWLLQFFHQVSITASFQLFPYGNRSSGLWIRKSKAVKILRICIRHPVRQRFLIRRQIAFPKSDKRHSHIMCFSTKQPLISKICMIKVNDRTVALCRKYIIRLIHEGSCSFQLFLIIPAVSGCAKQCTHCSACADPYRNYFFHIARNHTRKMPKKTNACF